MNKKAVFQDYPESSKLLLLLGLILISTIIFSLLSFVVSAMVYGVNMLNQPNFLAHPEALSMNDVNALKAMQTIQAFGLFVAPSLLFAFLISNERASELSMLKPNKTKAFGYIAIIMILAQPAINLMSELNNAISLPSFLSGVEQWMRSSEESAAKITEVFLRMENTRDLLINLFVVALLPAFGEELLFRGIIQKHLGSLWKKQHLAIWVSAILFSALHMQFFGFFPRMFMGAAFGYMLVWSGSLWVPVLGHFINNGLAVVLSYLSTKGMIDKSVETIGAGENFALSGIISIGLCLSLMLMYTKDASKKLY